MFTSREPGFTTFVNLFSAKMLGPVWLLFLARPCLSEKFWGSSRITVKTGTVTVINEGHWSGESRHRGNGASIDIWSKDRTRSNVGLIQCQFTDVWGYTSDTYGCSVCHFETAFVNISECTFKNCSASQSNIEKSGGVVDLGEGPNDLFVEHCTFERCKSKAKGGILYMTESTGTEANSISVTDTDFRDCWVYRTASDLTTFDGLVVCRSVKTFTFKDNEMTWSGTSSQRVQCKSVMSFSFADPDNGEVVIDNCYVNETQLLKGFVFLESAAKSFTYKNVVIDGVDCGYQNEEEYKSA